MENKLQELTQKLYEEGLSKGKQDAETLVEDAKKEAKKIIAEARGEADRITRDATSRAIDLHKNTITELNLAGKQATAKLKQSVREMIVAKATENSVKDAAMDPGFIKEVLLAVAKNWKGSSDEAISLKAMLPTEMKAKFDNNFEESIKKTLNDEIEIEYSDGIKSGFKIAPKDGRYYINFTDNGFDALLGEYLRPKVSEVLYGTTD